MVTARLCRAHQRRGSLAEGARLYLQRQPLDPPLLIELDGEVIRLPQVREVSSARPSSRSAACGSSSDAASRKISVV